MTATPLHHAGPVPVTPPEHIAPVIQLPIVATAPAGTTKPSPRVPTGRRHPPRRAHNGHHPDCPYGAQATPEHCGVCQGLRKGRDPERTSQ